MKKSILLLGLAALTAISFTSCEKENKPGTPEILATPVVTYEITDETTLTFSWSPVENATGYIYEYDKVQHEIAETSFSLTDLKPGTYEVRVKAIGENNAQSNWGDAKGGLVKPEVLKWLGTYTVKSSQTLSWSINSDNTTTMNLEDNPMDLTLEVAANTVDLDYVFIYGFSGIDPNVYLQAEVDENSIYLMGGVAVSDQAQNGYYPTWLNWGHIKNLTTGEEYDSPFGGEFAAYVWTMGEDGSITSRNTENTVSTNPDEYYTIFHLGLYNFNPNSGAFAIFEESVNPSPAGTLSDFVKTSTDENIADYIFTE